MQCIVETDPIDHAAYVHKLLLGQPEEFRLAEIAKRACVLWKSVGYQPSVIQCKLVIRINHLQKRAMIHSRWLIRP